MSELRFVRMGFGAEAVEYQEAWDEQRRVHAARFLDEVPDTCLLLEHPPVYTAGRLHGGQRAAPGRHAGHRRGPRRQDHLARPGPARRLPHPEAPRPVDVVAHVRRLEEALIRTCAEFGLETSRVEGRSGVWILGDAKDPAEQLPALGGLSLDFDPRLQDEEFDPRLDGPEYAPSSSRPAP